jgi:hypothetical protein
MYLNVLKLGVTIDNKHAYVYCVCFYKTAPTLYISCELLLKQMATTVTVSLSISA